MNDTFQTTQFSDTPQEERSKTRIRRYRISGLTCADCAARIEKAAAGLPGVRTAKINPATGTIRLETGADRSETEGETGDRYTASGDRQAASGDPIERDRRLRLARLIEDIEPAAYLDSTEEEFPDEGAPAETPDGFRRESGRSRGGRTGADRGWRGASLVPAPRVVRVVLSVLLFAAGVAAVWSGFDGGIPVRVSPVLFAGAYILSGYPVLWSAFRRLVSGSALNEHVLMTIATAGAWLLGESGEAAAVMVFYQIGDTLQALAVNRSRNAVAALLDLRPRRVRRVRAVDRGAVDAESSNERADSAENGVPDGSTIAEESVSPESIVPGDVVVCLPGERLPVDGLVHSGRGALDTSAVSGESVPRDVAPGANVQAGSVCLDARLEVRATVSERESTVARMLALVEDAAERKAPTEQLMTRLARVYTPIVVGVATALALLPPLVGLGTFDVWVYRALVFLVVSCPCALVVSIPLGYFAGIGAASRRGILVKGGQYLDALSRVTTVVFDKTGTITTGAFGVIRVQPGGDAGALEYPEDRKTLLCDAYRATRRSNHPAARAVRDYTIRELPKETVALIDVEAKHDDNREVAGGGVLVHHGTDRIVAGSARHLVENGIALREEHSTDRPPPSEPDANSEKDLSLPPAGAVPESDATAVHVGRNGRYQGCFFVADRIREDAASAVKTLRCLGIDRIGILSGDRYASVDAVSREIGADFARAELLPDDKVRVIEELVQENRVAFVGDGINDAAVIARADAGIAMGGLGSDAAVEAADVVLMRDMPGMVPVAIAHARYTRRIIMQNVVFALGTKGVFLLAAATGVATIWMAVFADVGVTVLTVFNTLRILRERALPQGRREDTLRPGCS